MYSPPKVKAVTVMSILCLFTGISVMIAWAVNWLPFESEKMDFLLIMFNPGLAFFLLGLALLLTQFGFERYNAIVFVALAFLIFLIGAVSLSQDVFHFNAGLDQLFITDHLAIARKYAHPGRMSSLTAFCFVLFGLSFFAFSTKKRFIQTIGQYLLHTVTAIAIISVIGFLYGLHLFYNFYYVFTLAVPTAVLFFLVSVIASLLHPSLGITGLFTGKLVGNTVIRRLSILIALRIIIFGAFRLESQHYKFFSLNISISLLALCFLLAGIAIILHTAGWLNKVDKKRYEAEEEVKVLNEELEKRVENRTAQFLILLEELKKSEENYRSLIEQASDAIYIHDFKGAFTDVNASMCKMTGYSREELMESSIIDLLEPEQLKADPMLLGALGLGNSIIKERQLIHKNGQMFDVEVNLKTIADNRMLVIARDITERKIAGEILKRSEANLKIVMDATDTAYVLMDSKLKIMTFNPMAVKLLTEQFNYVPVKGDLLADHISKARYAQFTMYTKDVLKGSSLSYEVDFRQTDGSLCWYNSRLFPIANDKNEIFGLMLAVTDISERKNAEMSLKTAYTQIQGHVQSIKDMVWKQSYLVRAPLANLKGLIGMLRDEPSDDRILKYIQVVLERLDEVIITMDEDAAVHES